MPKLVERLAKLFDKEKKINSPYAYATAVAQKAKLIKKGTSKLTKKGKSSGLNIVKKIKGKK